MITKISHVSFVRSVKVRKTKANPIGFKANTNKSGQNYIWEDGLYIEKNNGMVKEGEKTFGVILDKDLNPVQDVWDVHDMNEFVIGNLKIGKK